MKVALIHYWLVGMRGGEKVLEALLELFPQADIYTHVYDPASISPLIRSKKVYTSYINKLPFAKKLYQAYMPLMPRALLSFDLSRYDLVISSESGPAKGVTPAVSAYHLCYCHTPMRYLWDMYHEYGRGRSALLRFFMHWFTPSLRVWDATSANLVDLFAANSSFVAKRILRYYGRESVVVYPPVDVERYFAVERNVSDYYLFFGHFTGYKRADIAIEACERLGRKLVVAGGGAAEQDRQRHERTGLIKFAGFLDGEAIARHLSEARALLFPGIEDFGIIPVEAAAAGCPVIAYREGGALDTVKDGETGLFFEEQTPESLMAAIESFEAREGSFKDRRVFTEHAARFSKQTFKEGIKRLAAAKKRV